MSEVEHCIFTANWIDLQMKITPLSQVNQSSLKSAYLPVAMWIEWWSRQDQIFFPHRIVSILQHRILLSIRATHTYGPSLHTCNKHVVKQLPSSLLSVVQNVPHLYDVAKHTKSHLYCDGSLWVVLKQVWFSSVIPVGFKETFVVSTGRSNPTDIQDSSRSIWLEILDFFFCPWCTPGQWTKNTLTKENSLYSAVFFLTSFYTSV